MSGVKPKFKVGDVVRYIPHPGHDEEENSNLIGLIYDGPQPCNHDQQPAWEVVFLVQREFLYERCHRLGEGPYIWVHEIALRRVSK
jgi:hypothetical protein